MKKIFFVLAILAVTTLVISSCASSRRSGCPMAEGIIH